MRGVRRGELKEARRHVLKGPATGLLGPRLLAAWRLPRGQNRHRIIDRKVTAVPFYCRMAPVQSHELRRLPVAERQLVIVVDEGLPLAVSALGAQRLL